MPSFADLEITLFRSDSDTFGAEMRFCPANSDEEKQLLTRTPELKFDFDKLRANLLNPAQYGQTLTECLFSDPDMRTAFGQDGQIDRAVSAARGAVRERPDWWMPVLFTRLKSGRLWYTPGFAAENRGEGAEKWPSLFASISDEECTPIIGCEPLFGMSWDIARSLAEEFRFPLAPHDRENLPQVAQFISVDQTQKALHHAIFRNFYARLLERFRGELNSSESPGTEGALSLKAIFGISPE